LFNGGPVSPVSGARLRYVFAHARRNGVLRDPEAFGLRGPFHFRASRRHRRRIQSTGM